MQNLRIPQSAHEFPGFHLLEPSQRAELEQLWADAPPERRESFIRTMGEADQLARDLVASTGCGTSEPDPSGLPQAGDVLFAFAKDLACV